MSWQERVEKYHAKQAKQREAERRIQTEQREAEWEAGRPEREARLRLVREKIPLLLGILKQLHAEDLLSQIRDEVWRVEGRVSLEPNNIDGVDFDTPVLARAVLEARWLFFVEAGERWENWPPCAETNYPVLMEKWTDHLKEERETLSVTASYFEKGEIVISITSGDETGQKDDFGEFKVRSNLSEAAINLEESLVQYTLEREKNFFHRFETKMPGQRKKEAEDRIVEAIIKRNFKEAPSYLLERANKLKR